jgi:hypothetical protein
MYIHAERLLAKAGRQGARGGESPILGAEAKLERKGRSAAEVCTSGARKTAGSPLRRARAEPSARVWYPLRARNAHISIGRCGVYPLDWGSRKTRPDASRRRRLELGQGSSPYPAKVSRML